MCAQWKHVNTVCDGVPMTTNIKDTVCFYEFQVDLHSLNAIFLYLKMCSTDLLLSCKYTYIYTFTYFYISNSKQMNFYLLLLWYNSVTPVETTPDIASCQSKCSTGGIISCM